MPKTNRRPRADAFDAPEAPARPKLSPEAVAGFVGGRAAEGAKPMGRKPTRPAGWKKLQIYMSPETYADLGAGKERFGKPMSDLIVGLIEEWAVENRDELDATKKALKTARGR